ncbi:unnamed protein product [Arctogadus glacialis]
MQVEVDEWRDGGGGGEVEVDEWRDGGGGGEVEVDEWRDGGGGGEVEVDEWRDGGGEVEVDESRDGGGGGEVEVDEWRDGGGGGEVEDYIWHKGSRCDAVVTEFQVMCLGVGASSLVLLLLFMIVVCFAKKLHVLKTENNKLRKRSSKYRPSSEQHNDNFSLSTIAEGSHPNKTMSRYTWECKTKEESDCQDEPGSQNKLEDPVKASPREDDSLNIHNSLTPKHENHKVLGEENSSEVNSLQNNMM